jgi:hypothetical protein
VQIAAIVGGVVSTLQLPDLAPVDTGRGEVVV